ncbi:serine/threonine-protein kinase [Urbifossiella limnaea]|uniref:Serine/threonine-protein kinase PrkC n=1 Tax=Urbifossiella limnaea TaxID=2528023 RepID=A0A517XZR4_9BACT|nr:serine/threonine-protein kinase [Urbifossiella limnaea]QDU23001.1 Serine/threonine-protein kinase PrkC [Urbifossiella limnaea]
MPAPASVPELLDRLRRSGLVPPDRLDGFVAGLAASGQSPATPAALLDRMVDAGMITRFHADKLAAGKYKGFQIGSYLILDQLGTGGMGQVYLAEHASMRRLVALKVLPVFAADDAVARERFLREARAAATLDHPNVVRVFDLCQEGRLLYLVMEYVEGISLQALVARTGPLDVTAACHYARQVLYGLQHAHDLGFVHRDIKPANLLLDRSGVVKILDLGLVRSQADVPGGLTCKLDNRTILGTADYVAPEQAVDSSNVDIRADLYSLGATLYFLLAGRTLFPDGRTAQKLVWQQIKEPVPVGRFRPEVPAGLADVVHTLLQKRPEDRFRTPAEAFEALAPWDDADVAVPPDEWMPPLPARVQASRTASAPGPVRASGSTSQILTIAMRSGTGLARRPNDPGSTAVGTGSGMRRADPSAETAAQANDTLGDTPGPPRRPRERKGFPLLVWVVVCAAAAAAAATAAVVTAMR